jgi:hypothetical protein
MLGHGYLVHGCKCVLLTVSGPPRDGMREDLSEMIRERYSASAPDLGTTQADFGTTVCTWEVLPSNSRFPLIATGVSTDIATARNDAEAAMDAPGAGFGHLVRTAVPGLSPANAEREAWPPLGEVQRCRRNRVGGFDWRPLYPS